MYPQRSAACWNIRAGLRSPKFSGDGLRSQINPIKIHAMAVRVASCDVMFSLVPIARGNTCEPCMPEAIVDSALVSMFVSIWIFEGDLEVYIFDLVWDSS
jgi:hypothetical protein